jgi:pimeloyl-ACP methyl ester carboxylesterase
MGGMIAQTLAIRHPDRLRSLTCISATPSPDIGRMKPMTMLRLRANPAVLIGRRPRGPDESAERFVRGHRVIGSPGYPLDENVATDHRQADVLARRFRFRRRTRQRAAILASGDRRPGLAALHMPTLVLHGQADPMIRPDGGHATAAAIADATLVLLPGMGHDLPKALWPTIISHIRDIANRAEPGRATPKV